MISVNLELVYVAARLSEKSFFQRLTIDNGTNDLMDSAIFR
jgi:hypothetical protein